MASALDADLDVCVANANADFSSVPDELVEAIFIKLPCAELWRGALERVCKRWARLMQESTLAKRKRDARWAAYEDGVIKPRVFSGHTKTIWALAIGLNNGKVYSGSADKTIRVWSCEGGALLQTLHGHTAEVNALAVGPDEKLYSGSMDHTIRVWSGDDGTHLQTLLGHTQGVRVLAVGVNDGRLYSGSMDCTVRVWSRRDGTLVQTLVGHGYTVVALAIGLNGKLYSGSWDYTIRVWSSVDGTHLQTIEHSIGAFPLVVGSSGKLFSGGEDGCVRVCSPDDGALVQKFENRPCSTVFVLAVGSNGRV